MITVQALSVSGAVRRSLLGGRVLAKLLRSLTRWRVATGSSVVMISPTSGLPARGLARRLQRQGWLATGITFVQLESPPVAADSALRRLV